MSGFILISTQLSVIINIKKGRGYMPLPRERTYTSEDYWNLPEGQRSELTDGKLYSITLPSFM